MFDRVAGEQRRRSTRDLLIPAPVGGWVQSGNVTTAPLTQAEVLDNFIPTAQGARLRGGSQEYADLGVPITRLFTFAYGATQDFFAGSEAGVFDVGRVQAGGSNAFYDVEGLSSGDWSAVQVATTGGQFLVAVNGSDTAHYFDGAEWNPITTAAIHDLAFDAETAAFTVGETVTGGTSGATATVQSITKTSATAGTLKVSGITGTFQNNEALTDPEGGGATSDIPSGTSAASSITVSGVATSALSQVWAFKTRLFFIEKDTQSAWYLPAAAIGGTASELPLGALFRKGGNLLFGATWSIDSGSGLDDVCIFATDAGEVAVYEGTDPASASTWRLVGIYDIAPPLNKHAWFRAGGDLAVLTTDGIISIAEALRKDRGALQQVAITYPIEDAWQAAIAQASTDYPVNATLWQSRTLLLVGTPAREGGSNVAFAANSRTGAWGRITGWDVRCSVVFGDELYFADSAGKVLRADSGGNDDGAQYTGRYVPKFTEAGVSQRKFLTRAAATVKSTVTPTPNFSMWGNGDYEVKAPAAPSPAVFDEGATWGSGAWGAFVWGSSGNFSTAIRWKAIRGSGHAIAPGLMVTSNSTAALNFELLSMRVRFEVGGAL